MVYFGFVEYIDNLKCDDAVTFVHKHGLRLYMCYYLFVHKTIFLNFCYWEFDFGSVSEYPIDSIFLYNRFNRQHVFECK